LSVNIGDIVSVSDCITKEKFIAGRSLAEIERILGFHAGRLSDGMVVVAWIELPEIQQFELAAYFNVATLRHRTPQDLNKEKVKAAARASWTTSGSEQVVKVLPAIGHNRAMIPDIQYPPGRGAPQWTVTVPLQGRVVRLVSGYPNARYIGADVARR
jgi:hypothetical protein